MPTELTMPRKKCKCKPGVPEWVTTYGDLMSLLLVFFVLLAAVSELRRDRDFQQQLQSIREAFGYTGGSGYAPMVDAPQNTVIQHADAIQLFRKQHDQISDGQDPGIEGTQPAVTAIREGMQFVVGGVVSFEPGSAEVTPSGMRELEQLADEIRGKTNKVEIRGHAANRDRADDHDDVDLWDLSHQRADAVRRALTDQFEINPRRLRVVAAANHEPLAQRVYREHRHAVNRRVELIVSEALVDDLQGPPDRPSPTSP